MRWIRLLMGVAVCAAGTGGVRADGPDVPERMLHGHQFIPFEIVDWAFVTQRVSLTSAMGIARFEVDVPEGGSDTGGFAAFLQSVRADLVATPWLGYGFEVFTIAGMATNVPGAIEVGMEGGIAAQASVVGRFSEGPRHFLSGRLDGWVGPHFGVVPRNLIDTIEVEDGEVTYDAEQLVTEGWSFTVRPALAGALAVRRWLGLQASAGLEVRRATLDDDHDWSSAVVAGLGATFELQRLPLAFQLAGGLTHELGDDGLAIPLLQSPDDTYGTAELGLFYSGRANLDLGLSALGNLGDRGYRALGSVRMAYYW